MDAFDYVISEIFNQLTLDDLGQWHLVAFFSKKVISVETWYKTYDRDLLAIVEVFKTWKHYLEGCKYEVLVLTDHNNLQHFIDMKNLSSRQVCLAQKWSKYHFWIDYRQNKANGASDALFQYSKRSADKKKIFQAKNTKNLQQL